MKKKKIVEKSFSAEPQKFSFDTEAVIYLAAIQHSIRLAIEERMVEIVGNSHCIPVSVAKKVVKEFDLQKYDTFTGVK